MHKYLYRITIGLISLIISCQPINNKASNENSSKSNESNTTEVKGKPTSDVLDPIEKVKEYIKAEWMKDSLFDNYQWGKVEEWNALSFKYVVRFKKGYDNQKALMSDAVSATLTLDSLGNIMIVMSSDDKKEFYEYYDSLGVPKDFYSSRKFEKIGYEQEYEMITIDEHGVLSIVGEIPDTSSYSDKDFFNFIQQAIPGSDSLDFQNVHKVSWGNQIYEGEELEFEVKDGIMRNIKRWP